MFQAIKQLTIGLVYRFRPIEPTIVVQPQADWHNEPRGHPGDRLQ